ncbi:TonB-dependent receptor domain-containing protein [Candidatus Neomarinimicrobiota bacterium]
MTLMRIRTTIIIIFFPIIIFATGNNLSGNIFDGDNGEPLGFANVFFEGTDIGTTTNEDGYFSFVEIPFNEGTLKVSMMGYEAISQPILFPVNNLIELRLEKTLIEMSSIVITGTRTERYLKDVPVTTQVIKGAKLNESNPMDVSQVLNELTGISIVENQFGTGAELSGFDADHILVLVDGMELVGRTNGQLDISQIITDQIERIEVVKGASSALYGSEAMGGIINIITKKPQKDFSISLGGDAGSYGRYNGNLTLTGGLASWKSKLFLNVRRYGGNDLSNSSIWENGNSYNKYNTGLRLENSNFLSGILRFDSKIFKERQKLNTDDIFEDVTDNLRLTNRLEYEGDRDKIKYKTGVEYSYFDHLYEQFFLPIDFKESSDRTIDKLFKTDMSFELNGQIHKINGGIGYEVESIESDRIQPNNKSSNILFGFGQDEWSLNDKFVLLAGLRADYHSIYGDYYSPKLSVMYKPKLISRIRLSYGKGFKAPTFKEMFLDYIVTQLTPPLNVIGNPNLKPEVSSSIMIDFERWKTNRYHGRINFFYNEIQNLIDYVPREFLIDGKQVWQTQNIDNARTQGFDIDFTYFFTRKIEFVIGYSYLDTWDVDNDSPINLKAKHKGNAKLRVQLPWDIKFNIRSQFIGERYYGEYGNDDTNINEEWIDEYVLLHTNINFSIFKNIYLHVGVNNLTDVYDEVWGPMPGREWYIGLKFNKNK